MNTSTLSDYQYHPHILPDDCIWVGAIADQDGYNGHSYVANVCRDSNQKYWVFTKHGRFTIDAEQFMQKRISHKALAGVPYVFHPIDNISGISDYSND